MSNVLEADPVAPFGLRERKKRATRLALRAAALDLVAERGIAKVTVEDIAAAAEVSTRTFFNYFDSKEAALVGEDPDLLETMRLDLLALPLELSPLAALRSVAIEMARVVGEDAEHAGDRRVWRQRLAVVRSDPELLAAFVRHHASLERILTAALLERLGGGRRMEAYAALMAACAFSAMRVAWMCWDDDAPGRSLVELVTAAFDLLGSGLDLGSGDLRLVGGPDGVSCFGMLAEASS